MSSDGSKKIGYDEDDSRLGGPLSEDKRPVFRVESSHRQYWRVETKDIYTGKGWEKSGTGGREFIDGITGKVPVYFTEVGVAGEDRFTKNILYGKSGSSNLSIRDEGTAVRKQARL